MFQQRRKKELEELMAQLLAQQQREVERMTEMHQEQLRYQMKLIKVRFPMGGCIDFGNVLLQDHEQNAQRAKILLAKEAQQKDKATWEKEKKNGQIEALRWMPVATPSLNPNSNFRQQIAMQPEGNQRGVFRTRPLLLSD